MNGSKNELKTFTAAIIEALCDVRVKARDSLPWGSFELFYAIKMPQPNRGISVGALIPA
ncbi:hypothetical protein [Caballeronia sp.]|jgi:hypothetical protein|uniref:hypothetical protein n=1 Tax=Caballeronia sp. TaxID=1931223 RepID=UPI002621F53C|nr:hypothetical protein [Caballeronia sp.]